VQRESKNFFAELNLYSYMAHYVGKELGIRPNDILDYWGVPELLVAYGTYANEMTYKNYMEWKGLDSSTRGSIERPKEYAVKFFPFSKLEEI
jgi:hypothetical protein